MGLPPPLGASSRRVRCRLSVRSRAIHPAAGALFRRGLFISPRATNSPQAIHFAAGAITPQAIHLAAGYSSRRRRYFAAGYSFRRRLFISPRAINSPQALQAQTAPSPPSVARPR